MLLYDDIHIRTLIRPIHSGLTEPVLTSETNACSNPSRIETKFPPSFLQNC